MKLKYHAEIDGLRAFAVLSVVIFHIFPSLLEGGFIGVDVFFVISGYLISHIIIENLHNDTFKFGVFYARRIRRLFPALLIVLLTVLIFGWMSLFADEYHQLGKHTISSTAFATAAETKLLLHLWSLAVEEQFYVFWPISMWIAYKLKINLLKFTIVCMFISFCINLWLINDKPVEAFF